MTEDEIKMDLLYALGENSNTIHEIGHLVKQAEQIGVDIMKLHYNIGPTPISQTDTDIPVLMMAIAINGSPDVIQCLLNNGADVTHGTSGGFSPLHLLASADPEEVNILFVLDTAREFIKRGADVDGVEGCNPPIFYALRNPEMVRLLIESGCDVHRMQTPGMTLLMYAAQTGYTESVHLLIKAGVDLDLKDNRGWTAVDWARFTENVGATKVLENAISHRDGHLSFALGMHEGIGSKSLMRLISSDVIDEILNELNKQYQLKV